MKKELQEAIEAARGLATLLKSQMAFDFTAPTSTPNAHHKAYTRRTRSGGTSQIQARGVQRQEEPVVVQHATPHAGHAIPPPPEVAHLVTQVETAAQGLLTNPAMAPHKAEIEEMISDLKKYPSAKHAKVVVEQMKELAEIASAPKTVRGMKAGDYVKISAHYTEPHERGIRRKILAFRGEDGQEVQLDDTMWYPTEEVYKP